MFGDMLGKLTLKIFGPDNFRPRRQVLQVLNKEKTKLILDSRHAKVPQMRGKRTKGLLMAMTMETATVCGP